MSVPRVISVPLVRPTLIAAALLLVGLIVPSAARASCGDWLEGHDEHAAEPGVTTAAASLPGEHVPAQPCQRSECRRAPAAPSAPAPPAPSVERGQSWACPADASRNEAVPSRRVRPVDALVVATGDWPRLERPPRLLCR